jgi:hypothetical protein
MQCFVTASALEGVPSTGPAEESLAGVLARVLAEVLARVLAGVLVRVLAPQVSLRQCPVAWYSMPIHVCSEDCGG